MWRFTLILILLFNGQISAQENSDTKFYNQRSKGWFWHEPEPLPEPEQKKQEPQPTTTQPTKPEQQALNSEWLKANLDRLTMQAVDNPTHENLAAYAYANRLMMDLGSRFSSRMMEFMTLEQELQESTRRPFTTVGLNEFAGERGKAKKEIMETLKAKTHIWLFFSSQCSFCVKQIPILNYLQRETGIPILAISMDGGVLPGMENFEIVYDEGLRVSEQFGVSSTPTMHFVVNDKKVPIPLTVGLNSYEEIEKRLLLVSREAGVITNEQYVNAKEVRDIGVFKNEAGEIMADKKRLENDPAYLVELLKMRLKEAENSAGVNSTPVNFGSK